MPVLTEEEMLNRVRSLLKCASRRGYAARSATPGSEIWKILFNAIDIDGSGALDFMEIKRMVRMNLKLPERVVSDYELMRLFRAIDDDDNGTVDFAEFMEYTSQGKVDKRPLAVALRQIARVIRLSLRRRRVKLVDLSSFCYDFSEVDFQSGHGQMIFEDHSQFFRNHLLLGPRECSNSNLNQLFKLLCRPQERPIKTILATDFLDSIRFMASTDDFGGASPPRAHRGLIGGMQGYLPDIANKPRPGGFLIQGSSAEPPFCYNGRDLPPATRNAVNDRNFATIGERNNRRLKLSSSAPTLPTVSCGGNWGGFSEINRRYAELGNGSEEASEPEDEDQRVPTAKPHVETAIETCAGTWAGKRLLEALAEHADYLAQPPTPTANRPPTAAELKMKLNNNATPESRAAEADKAKTLAKRAKDRNAEEMRSAYFVLNGAEALNRVEHRLFHAGLDVRGHFHRRHADAAQATEALSQKS